jgi:hypothetical protein
MEDLSEITFRHLVEKALPELAEDERQILVTTARKLFMMDTWEDTPYDRSQTNFHGEAYAKLRELAPALAAKYPGNVYLAELARRYGGAGKTTSW